VWVAVAHASNCKVVFIGRKDRVNLIFARLLYNKHSVNLDVRGVSIASAVTNLAKGGL
jgi:DNA-binding protein